MPRITATIILDHTQGAAKLCKLLLKSNPDDFSALVRLGMAKGKVGQHEVLHLPTRPMYSSFYEPGFHVGIRMHYTILRCSAHMQEALAAYKKASKLQPQNAFVLASMGAVKYNRGAMKVFTIYIAACWHALLLADAHGRALACSWCRFLSTTNCTVESDECTCT